jgi:hypothetical protein
MTAQKSNGLIPLRSQNQAVNMLTGFSYLNCNIE